MIANLTIPTLALFGTLGMPELIVLAILGVLIFGKRLPEVGKSIGKGIVEFKKGLSGIEDDVDRAAHEPPRIEKRDAGSRSVDTQQRQSEQASSADDRPDASA
jgi:sec-independent protein translocase protein TatA